ncbi:MAG: thrombospondin type 3 repeat-containing protein, partial [Myxococcales bacterium]|nr:thrombospondin type 3 repeat-containing protein [Myxococcales bacterium]
MRRSLMMAAALTFGVSAAAAQTLPPDFSIEVVDRLTNPTGITFGPNGWLWAAEKRGKVWIYVDGQRVPEPFIELDGPVNDNRDGGLLGIAVHPDFEQNGFVFLLFVVDPDETEPNATGEEVHTYARLERYAADPATGLLRADPASRTVLVGAVPNEGFPVCHSSHMIGTLRFGEDGTLFAGSGDGAHFNGYDVGGRDPECFDPDGLPQFDGEEFDIGALRSIHPDSPSGKILRIDPFTGLGLPSNPYWDGNPASVRSKTWVSGLRNPFRFGLRPNTGSPDPADGLPGTLYAGDVGWSTWEEVNVGYGGENFGWPCYEGDAVQGAYRDQSNGACATLYDGTNPYGPDLDAAYKRPLLAMHHGNGNINGLGFTARAVGGTAFYEGGDYPRRYNGVLFQADYPTSWIRAVWVDENDEIMRDGDGNLRIEPFVTDARQPIDLRIDPQSGDLYYVSWQSKEIRRIRYRYANQAPFIVWTADPTNGPAPLQVQFDAQASFDLDEDPVFFEWDFGDGTTSAEPAPLKVYPVGGAYTVRLTVRDDRRGATTRTQVITVGNLDPMARVIRPLDGATYTSPQEIVLAGVGSDPEDLDDVDFHWTVDRLTDAGSEDAWFEADGPVATFMADDPDQPSYRVTLTVTDRDGATASDTVTLRPFSRDDVDGDGAANGVDNCRDVANPDQTDTDRDGRGDACDDDDDGDGVADGEDGCPLDRDPNQLDLDEDGQGDACDEDDDGDEVPDAEDNCPLLSNAGQLDLDHDGLGDACDPDLDGDGVQNDVDNCLETPNLGQ